MKKVSAITIAAFATICLICSFIRPVHLTDENTRRKVSQDIVDNLIGEKYDDVRKDFDPSLKQGLSVEKIAEVWRQTGNTYGKFKKVISVAPSSDRGYNQIKMRLEFDNGNLTQETTFTQDDKVIGLYLKP